MKYFKLVTITAFIFTLGACSKRAVEATVPDPPTIHVQPGAFYLHYNNKDIVDPNAIEPVIKECKPRTLDLKYAPNSTTADLNTALSHFGELGIGDYNFITDAGETFPFFIPGIPDGGALARIVDSAETKYDLDEVLGEHFMTSIPEFSHIRFPNHPVGLADLEKCLRRCKPSRCIVLDWGDRGWFFTGRYEDWITTSETKNAGQVEKPTR